MTGRYIVVEGPIGVGKTGLVAALKERLQAKTFIDASNPFLPSFYQDMDKFAFQVQLYFLLTRFQQQKELAQGDLFVSTVLCDYLFQKDRLFASLTLQPNEYSLYEKVYALLQGTIATPDVVIYMQADVDTLLDRISRNDEGLALLMPESYLKEIVQAYQTFFLHYANAPVLVLNTMEHDYAGNPKYLEYLLDQLNHVQPGVHHLRPNER